MKSHVNLNTTWGPGFARITSDDVAGTVTIEGLVSGAYVALLTIDVATGAATLSDTLTVTDSVTGTGVVNTAAVTDLAGTTAGNAYWVEDETGTVKRVIVALVGYENTTATAQTVTFPVQFTKEGAIVTQPASFGATVTTTTLTLPASMTGAVSGVIVVQGI